jgi:ATP-dependent RNA helicase RhlE
MSTASRAKLRDVERLIRRTLPVSGEIKQQEMTPPKAKTPHRGQGPKPEGGRPNGQRPQRNAGRHFSGAKKAAINAGRPGGGKPQRPRQKQRATA